MSAAVPETGPVAGLAGAGLPAVAPRTLNAEYLGHRLVYDKTPEPPFDPLERWDLVAGFLVSAFRYLMIFVLTDLVTGAVLLLLAVLGLGFGAAAEIWLALTAVSGFGLGCLFWLLPRPVLLSEWKFAVDDYGAAAALALEHIAWAFTRHQTPADVIQVRRLRLRDGARRDYLEVRRGLFMGFTACFGFGRDLYIGWTFWVRISPLRWVIMAVADLWRSLTRPDRAFFSTLSFDSARALREAIHSVAREGVDVTLGMVEAQGAGIIGGQVPVAIVDLSV